MHELFQQNYRFRDSGGPVNREQSQGFRKIGIGSVAGACAAASGACRAARRHGRIKPRNVQSLVRHLRKPGQP